MSKAIFIGALGLFLASQALAQTAAQTSQDFDQMNQPNWEGAIADAFFIDGDTSAPRPEEEMRANWDALGEQERDQVRRDCAALSADAGDIGGAASGGLADVDVTTPETAPLPPDEREPVAAEADSLARVCAIFAGA